MAGLSSTDFLSRVDQLHLDIDNAHRNIAGISQAFSRSINVLNQSDSAQLEQLMVRTQTLHANSTAEVKRLESDAAREPANGMKALQVRALKTKLTAELELFRQEEHRQRSAYREQLARDYRIVHPEAPDAEVFEASQADWGDEGVFEASLRSNQRSTAATTALGNVRARHHDVQRIENSLLELNDLFAQLAATVEVQEPQTVDIEKQTGQVQQDTTAANAQLKKAEDSARRARKLKWWALWISILIVVIIIAVVVGVVCTQPGNCKAH